MLKKQLLAPSLVDTKCSDRPYAYEASMPPPGSSTKRTRKREFLGEMERVVPWSELAALIAPTCLKAGGARPPFPSKPYCASGACSSDP
jgi:hypothetical protein